MLALWSRATRNPGTCRCIQCVSNTTAIARRAGSVNVKGPWAFGTPTSTFVYTAIFAAGIAIDGKIKHDRNKQWNTAFDQLREEMVSSPADAQSQQELQRSSIDIAASTKELLMENDGISVRGYIAPEELFPDGADWAAIHRIAGTELIEDHVFQKRQMEIDLDHVAEDLWGLLQFDSKFPAMQALGWSVHTGPDLVRHHLPPQSLWSYDHVRRTALRKRQTLKKLVIQELSIGMLIQSLLGRARNHAWSEEDFEVLSPAIQKLATLGNIEAGMMRFRMGKAIADLLNVTIDDPKEEIFRVRNRFVRPLKPHYFQDDNGDFYDTCQQMNVAIKKLLDCKRPRDGKDLALALAKLSHNLLESSAAPDVQTFNILITGLKRWQMAELVDEVILALDACKIRPNEITCATILDHYINCSRPDDFSMFVAKMRGMKNALMLANPSININEASAGRLIRVDENKVYQKVYPTPLVFNTLMLGVLKFAGIERALEIYYEMKQDGWGLDVLGLTHFLIDCVYRADWYNGAYVWEEIKSIKRRSKASHMVKAYSYMLGLCSVTENTAVFNHILKDVTKQGFNQRDIVRSATGITRKARSQQLSVSPEQVPTAPAWTADNLLIAVSGYMGESRTSRTEPDPELDATEPREPNIQAPPELDVTASQLEPILKDSEGAWSAWMEYELGEQVNVKRNQNEIEEDLAPQDSLSTENECKERARSTSPLRELVDLEDSIYGWLKDDSPAKDGNIKS